MAQILLTGATGFIGDALLPALVNDRYSLICLTRDPRNALKKYRYLNASIQWITNFEQLESMPEYVINLSGEGIADSRWTDRRKQILRASRIDVTKALVSRLNQLDGEPSVVVSGSAVGYYLAKTKKIPGGSVDSITLLISFIGELRPTGVSQKVFFRNVHA